jgi:DNA mismatch repair protein MutS2
MFAVRALEFDRIVTAVRSLALTPLGASVLADLRPLGERSLVDEALRSTTETVAYLERNSLFPLRAGAGFEEALVALDMQGRPLEPLQLRLLADFLDSVDQSRSGIVQATGSFPILGALASRLVSFKPEVNAVRHAIDASGDVLDQASAALGSIRERLRQKRQRLRGTLEQFIRSRDTSKYLQEQVITERNGRYVLLVRAEHRSNVPGIVHGTSTSGASLFLEPGPTVEINNDIVELEEQEREEILRILLELTDRFRARPADLEVVLDVASTLDVLQAKARFSTLVRGVRPELATSGGFELTEARHPLLIAEVARRAADSYADRQDPPTPVPIDLALDPSASVLLITGPNTGGKTVALKTVGLLALMAQAGLHVPARVARLPVFKSVFADIGDEQSIAASLSTFSGHITNIAAMDRAIKVPALVLLDEVGTGTDPNEGGALATAIVNHFRQRGAIVCATTHYDALKTWGTETDGVVTAAFAFDPRTFAPTYRLIYGAPGRSLAIEIAQRLGLPISVISAARGFLSDDQKRLAAHLERVDAQARALDSERLKLQRERRAAEEASSSLRQRESALAEREERFNKRLNERLDDRLRQARREIDAVVDQLKQRASQLVDQASARSRGSGISTGDAGEVRGDARAAIDRIAEGLRQPATGDAPFDSAQGREASPLRTNEAGPLTVGARVVVPGFGLEGTVVTIQGQQAEIDVRGKRLRAPVYDLRVIGAAPGTGRPAGSGRVSVDLRPREGLLSELNIVGCTVDEGVDRVSRFLDDTLVTDLREIRIIHGHGTGQLRRGVHAFLKDHPLVTQFHTAPPEQGGGGATIVELKE